MVSQIFKPQTNYETAISSALGGAMYHIVTKDEASARHAIGFLKRNQSGRATFLPLTVMKPRRMQREHEVLAQNLTGYLGVATDFTECEETFYGLRAVSYTHLHGIQDEMNKVLYDARKTDAYTVMEDAQTYPFFSEYKAIIDVYKRQYMVREI